MSDILTAMRSATRAAHEYLESLTLGHKIMDGSLSPHEYRRILAWQRAAHQTLEPAVRDFSVDTYHYRPRFPSADTPQPTGGRPDRATAIGILYVLEGASLGAASSTANCKPFRTCSRWLHSTSTANRRSGDSSSGNPS